MRKFRRSAFLWLSLIVLLAGCGGGGGGGGSTGGGGDPGGGGGTPDYTVTVEPTSASGFQGAGVMVKVSVARKAGFTGEVSVTIANPPAGVTPDTLTLPDGISSGFLRIHLAPDISAGSSMNLSVIGSNGTSTATVPLTVTVKPSEPSSQAKIEAGVASGTIDYGTSLLYRAYAFHGDARLPDAYRGSGSEDGDNFLRSEILDATAGLSPALQAALEPFTVRPADPKSWYNQTSAQTLAASRSGRKASASSGSLPRAAGDASGWKWISKRRANPIRVWAQTNGDPYYDLLSAAAINEALNVFDKIWGPMSDDMGVRPIPDQEGGDDAIDVYIVDWSSSVHRRVEYVADHGQIGVVDYEYKGTGLACAYRTFPFTGKKSSGFILLQRGSLLSSRFHTIVIHEFFHVLQYAHNATLYHQRFGTANIYTDNVLFDPYWFSEASARWASVHYDRTLAWPVRAAYVEAHHSFTERFQKRRDALNVNKANGIEMYDAYIWAYFLEQETGGPDIIGAIWTGLETSSTREQADNKINFIYDFKTNFRIFALRNLNTEFLPGDPLPYNERYVSLDEAEFRDDKKEPPYHTGLLMGNSELPYDLPLEPLSADYLKFTVDDPAVKQVVFDLSGLAGATGLDVDALIKIKGKDWEKRDLNGKDELKFCFDKPGEELEDIRLVLSNHQYKQGERILAAFTAKSLTTSCANKPGTFSTKETSFGATGTGSWTSNGTATWRPSDNNIYTDREEYILDNVTATATYEIRGECNGHVTASLGMSEFPSQGSGFGGDKYMANYIWIFPDGSYYIHLSGRSLNPLPFTVTCGIVSGPASQYVAAHGLAPIEFNDLFDTSSSLKLINNRMQGSYTVNVDGGAEISFTWDFGEAP